MGYNNILVIPPYSYLPIFVVSFVITLLTCVPPLLCTNLFFLIAKKRVCYRLISLTVENRIGTNNSWLRKVKGCFLIYIYKNKTLSVITSIFYSFPNDFIDFLSYFFIRPSNLNEDRGCGRIGMFFEKLLFSYVRVVVEYVFLYLFSKSIESSIR